MEGQSLLVYLVDAWKERAMLGGRRKLNVCAFMSVREVKRVLSGRLGIPVSRQRLYWRSRELKDHRTLEESGIHQSGATLVFHARPTDDAVEESTSSSSGSEAIPWRNSGPLVPSLEPVSCLALHGAEGALPPALHRGVLKARRAMVVGAKAPELALDGTGGTYFLRGLDGRPAACFKPADEEPFCINNPRHFVGPYGGPGRSPTKPAELDTAALLESTSSLSMRRGVRPGEAYLREVAAYLLDRNGDGLAGVPETTIVECRHPKLRYADRVVVDKVGSLQLFVQHDGFAEDYGVDRLDLTRLQAIASLDIRALNCDRNSANLLVPSGSAKKSLRVVPIDHGFCLPELLEIEWFDWCWIDWPQIAAPVCESVKAAVARLDPEADAAMLRDTLGLRPKSLRLARAAAELLKRGVAAGLTLRDVASLVVVPQHDLAVTASSTPKSRLAAAVARADELASLALDEDRHPGRKRSPDNELARQFSGLDQNDSAADSGDGDSESDEELCVGAMPPARARMERPGDIWHLEEAKGLRESPTDPSLVLLSEDKACAACLRISISERPFPQDDDDDEMAREREEKNMAELERRVDAAALAARSDPVAVPFSTREAGQTISCSPRWVDGLPADVASRRHMLSCSPLTESSEEDCSARHQPRPSRHRRQSTEPNSKAVSRRSATPLIRLHSCPALADVVSSEDGPDSQKRGADESSNHHRSIGDDSEYNRHFFHFLHGILDDLIRWKLLAVAKEGQGSRALKSY